VPIFSLLGDGTLILPGAQVELYPGPALPAISSRQVDEAGIRAILKQSLDAISTIPAIRATSGSWGSRTRPRR
jgi:hypothetical protein